MLSKLEDALKEKEGELKLHHRFLNLKEFCEKEIFPFTNLPLRAHVEKLTGLVEKLIPEPKARTEEMFSGEIFVLLCALYFHDIGVVAKYGFRANEDILNRIDIPPKTLFLNYEVGKRLDIPEKAIELINALIFAPIVKKIPIEWEITEDTKRAIVRNAKTLEQVLSFAHLMWDAFSVDSGHTALKMFHDPDLSLRCGDTSLAVDSKEGLIFVTCRPEVPYQVHVLERVKARVDGAFTTFRNNVNGRLGFHYKEIVWDIAGGLDGQKRAPQLPQLFPFATHQDLLFRRWEEASRLLDKLFRFGQVIVVGDVTTGKTTMINSFVIPQLQRISANVFYCELWDNPVNEIRESVGRTEAVGGVVTGIDIVSICARLLEKGLSFFVLDGCERLKHVSPGEMEKFERFISFCLEREGVYLILSGDKKEFFDWYGPFRKISLSAIFEASALDKSGGRTDADAHEVEIVPLWALKQTLNEVCKGPEDEREWRDIVAVLVGDLDESLKRTTLANIFSETSIPHDRIRRCLDTLKKRGIVQEHPSVDATFYSLATRQLKEPLYQHMGLAEFEERRRIRESLGACHAADRFLPVETLDTIGRWIGRMVFTRDEAGLILGSCVFHGRPFEEMLKRTEGELRIVNSEPILRLLQEHDPGKREEAVRLLRMVKDDAMINPLLAHLKRERVPGIKGLLLEGFVATGKKRPLIALMKALAEMGDRESRLRAAELVSRQPNDRARQLLLGMAEIEKDREVIELIEALLAKLEESS